MKLYTDKVVKIYRSRTVVKEVSVEVSQGEIVGLLGPNGAGKTTTFYMVVGIIKPNSGRVFMEGDGQPRLDITTLPQYRRAQLGVGYLAQEASVFRQMSVEDNIGSILEFRKDLTREAYYNFYTFGAWGVASNYDLCIDSSILGIDGTADCIIDFGRRAGKIR